MGISWDLSWKGSFDDGFQGRDKNCPIENNEKNVPFDRCETIMRWKFWKKPPSLSYSKNIKRVRPPNRIIHRLTSQEGWVAILIPIITWIGANIGTILIVISLAYTVYSVVSSLLSKKSSGAGDAPNSSRNLLSSGHLINTRASSEPVTIPYGDCRLGGNIVYISSTGATNQYLHMVMTVGEGPVDGITTDEILTLDVAPGGTGWAAGDMITGGTSAETCEITEVITIYTYSIKDRTGAFTLGEILSNGTNTADQGPTYPTVATEDMIWLDDKRIQYYGVYATYEFFDGSGSQSVCTTLQGYDPNWDDAMRYTAYIYLMLTYNENLYANMPNITLRLRGRLLLDPRNNSTVYSNNNALVAYDFLRNQRYSIGISGNIDEDTINDAANWCDANGYFFDGSIMNYQSFLDNLNDILKNFRAGIIWSDGEYKLLIYEYDVPVMNLTEDEIVADSFRINIPGIPETPNRCIVNYIDAVDNYRSKQRIIEDPNAVLVYDLQERDFSLDLIGTTTAEYAIKLGTYYVERNRLNYQFSFSCAARALALEPLDMITITHYLPGWDQAILRVIDVAYSQGDFVKLTVIAEDLDLYDDVVDVSTHYAYITNLPGIPVTTYSLPIYADNAAAIAGGLQPGDLYRTPTGTVMVVYTP